MISKTEKEEEWFMLDPDFRWEGNMEREKYFTLFKITHLVEGISLI